MDNKNILMLIVFWIVWVFLLTLIPLYIFTFLFEIAAVKAVNIGSILSPVIGALVVMAQMIVFVKSFKQARRDIPISASYLTLIGGSILIVFIWAGGCAIMGPYRMAG